MCRLLTFDIQALATTKDEEARRELHSSSAVLQNKLAKAEESAQSLARDYEALKLKHDEMLRMIQATTDRRVEELQAQIQELQQPQRGKQKVKKLKRPVCSIM